MPQLRFVPAAFAATAVLFVSSFASAIAAPGQLPGCGSGPVCAYGFECAQVGASGCAPSAPCPAGEACPAPVPCTTTIEYGCVPAHCTADSQCASDMVCHAWTEPCAVTDCACPPNEPSCNCGSTPACDPQTVSMCTPRYDLPCKVAADCGAGFTCEEAQSCGCASSGGSAPPSSGGASSGTIPAPSYAGTGMGFPGAGGTGAIPAPAYGGTGGGAADPVPVMPPDCSCQPSGQMQCVAMDITCQTAAQCPAGWSCQVENVAAGAPACAPGANCPMLPAPLPPSSKCIPPYYGAQSGGDLEVPSTPTTGTGTTGPGTVTGTAGTGPSGTPNKGAPEPTTSAESHDVSACAMGHAPASTGALALLAMLGALFGLKRRRA